MTNEERDLILNFIQRVGGSQAAGFGSVPSTNPAMPPIDREADAFIAEQLIRFPEARYRITQLAFVQEHALAEASNRINQLQAENQALRQQPVPTAQPAASPWGQAAQQPPPQQQAQPSRGFFGGLFGGGQQAAPPPPQQQQYQQPQYQQPQYAPPPQYAPGYQPGMFQQRGSGFLGSALTTAAGVAGGMVAGHALMNLFSGSHNQGAAGGFGGGGFGSPASAPGYLPPQSPSAAPWAGEAAPSADPYEVGGQSKDASGYGNQDSGGWQQAASNPGGWQDAPNEAPSGGGWADAGGSDDET